MAQTIAAERRALEVKARQYQEALRKRLNGNLAAGSRHDAGWNKPLNMTDVTAAGDPIADDPRSTNLWFGMAVTDPQLAEVIRKSGGNPYLKKLKELEAKSAKAKASSAAMPRGRTGRGVAKAAEETAKSYLEQLADEYKRSQDEAFQANQNRYNEGHFELSDLRNRNSERVKNFGEAQRQDLEEQFSSNLGDVTANLSGRGLGNSTIVSAFEAKNARDLAREKLRLSEMVDDRASRYDSADTGNLVNFVERRNDVAPDNAGLMALAQAYGASGGQMGQQAGPQEERPQSELEAIGYSRKFAPKQLPYAVSPYVANEIAASYQGAYPSMKQMLNPMSIVNGIRGVVGDIAGVAGGVNSNRYPSRGERKPPTAKQQAALSQLQQRVRTRQGAYDDSGGYQGYVDRQQKSAYDSAYNNQINQQRVPQKLSATQMYSFRDSIGNNNLERHRAGWAPLELYQYGGAFDSSPTMARAFPSLYGSY
jgi:hypothetical protein